MTVFRWVIGSLGLLCALASASSFALFIASNVQVWIERARRWRHWTWLALLVWFNVEVWRSVVMVIVRW